jgi:hypothetical protein
MVRELLRFFETHANWLFVLSVSSAVMLAGSVLLVPWLVIRAPADVFVRPARVHRGPFAIAVAVVRNLLGAALFAAGLLMLVLPGQGMLTLVAALCLVDLPRKRALFRRLVARPALWKTLAWIRHRAGKPPFLEP